MAWGARAALNRAAAIVERRPLCRCALPPRPGEGSVEGSSGEAGDWWKGELGRGEEPLHRSSSATDRPSGCRHLGGSSWPLVDRDDFWPAARSEVPSAAALTSVRGRYPCHQAGQPPRRPAADRAGRAAHKTASPTDPNWRPQSSVGDKLPAGPETGLWPKDGRRSLTAERGRDAPHRLSPRAI